MPITISLPLDLPDVRVLSTRVLRDATLVIEVESTLRTAQCHCCGREIDRFHGFDRPIRWRYLPVFGRAVLIEIRPKRYCCPYCAGGPISTQRCSWYALNRPPRGPLSRTCCNGWCMARWPMSVGSATWGSRR